MGWDFRVESTYRTHPKFILLKQLYGSEGVDAVFALWAFATEERPKGILANMTDKKIAAACGIDPTVIDPSEFVNNLVEIGLLDRGEDDVVAIHNWKKRQPNIWSRGEKDPVKVAAANARWGKKEPDSKENNEKKQAVVNADAAAMQCMPSAMPHPIPSYLKSLSQAPDGERARALVFALMSESTTKVRAKSPGTWPGMLQGLLDEGTTLEDLERATRFAVQDPFWRSRIVSPKAYRDNYGQILDQANKAMVQEQTQQGDKTQQGMSAEAWEALKKKAKSEQKVSSKAVNAKPP
ncbi:MAG: hypothetical protein AAGU21_00950 [Solidesulfovibrio sp.]|uniref:hypothetical protein n=1 Tax=Solidesulfovibrio sp. TaxID=2910990 RepID=UPI002B2116FE|nr:hypothetical protein [Solidesulfovibrio sp.]MEA4857888.1 hypothetical protein [Solidesulfovibrio sp.]